MSTTTEDTLDHLEREYGQFLLVVRLANGNLGVITSHGDDAFYAQAVVAIEGETQRTTATRRADA